MDQSMLRGNSGPDGRRASIALSCVCVCVYPAGAHPHTPAAFFTGGIVHVPSRIEGEVSSGQYMRSMRMNLPAGAGSQFDSLSAPGESFWIRRSTEPSGLDLRFCRGLME